MATFPFYRRGAGSDGADVRRPAEEKSVGMSGWLLILAVAIAVVGMIVAGIVALINNPHDREK